MGSVNCPNDLAKLAKTKKHRMILKEMAEAWRKLAHTASKCVPGN
jgi:hypothetical protein